MGRRNKRLEELMNDPCLLIGSSYTKYCANCDGYRHNCKDKVYDTKIKEEELFYE